MRWQRSPSSDRVWCTIRAVLHDTSIFNTYVALVLRDSTVVVLAQKPLDAVLIDLAGLVELGQMHITLALSGSANVLHASQVVDTVRIDVAVLTELGQRSVTGKPVGDAVAGITVFVGLAVPVDMAGRATGRLGGRSHGEGSKHGGSKETGLHDDS